MPPAAGDDDVLADLLTVGTGTDTESSIQGMELHGHACGYGVESLKRIIFRNGGIQKIYGLKGIICGMPDFKMGGKRGDESAPTDAGDEDGEDDDGDEDGDFAEGEEEISEGEEYDNPKASDAKKKQIGEGEENGEDDEEEQEEQEGGGGDDDDDDDDDDNEDDDDDDDEVAAEDDEDGVEEEDDDQDNDDDEEDDDEDSLQPPKKRKK
uniref:Uncharacterized protein n=2 Tax=Aegilops tauschii TaxID=37682 RepID=R7W045_AEGTA